jgi:cell volume regulation protein A
MQIALFFLLGLLSFPSKITSILGVSIAIAIFLTFVSRPLTTFLILKHFGYSTKEKIFISWVGLRGAASLVFAIYAMTYGANVENDIFHIIFFIALFSVVIQGTLIPTLANKLDLVNNEEEGSVLKTFTDYTEEINSELLEFTITEESNLKNKMIMDANIPEEILIVMIKRGNQVLVPKGSVLIKEGDKLVLSGNNIERLIEETMI